MRLNKIIYLITIFSITNCDQTSDFRKEITTWSKSMAESFHLINNKSYFPVSVQDAMIKAIDAFVRIDDYSHFLGPKDYNELLKTTRGEFYGIGVDLAPKKETDDSILVLDVLPESPAQSAGLRKYDKIIAIDEKAVGPLTTQEAISKITGEKRYSIVNITVLRDSQNVLHFKIKRDLIKDKPITCYYFRNQNIFYCAISLFTQNIAKQLKHFLKKLYERDPNPKGIILDLRDNTGGVLKSAAECAALFLPKNSAIVSAKDKNLKAIEQYYTEETPIINNNTPIIILINGYTASASEILAGALKYYSAKSDNINNPYIFLMGTTTYGKGSVQEVIPVSNNCALKLTTCLYYLPDNSCIDSIGITPDFPIEQKYPPSEEAKKLDKLMTKEKKKKKNTKTDIKEEAHTKRINAVKNDYQIQQAIDIVSLINLAKKQVSSNSNIHSNVLNFVKSSYAFDDNIKLEEIK